MKRSEPRAPVLYAAKEPGGVRLSIVGGAPPFELHRGSFPTAEAGITLAGPGANRSLRDTEAGPRAAYRVDPVP